MHAMRDETTRKAILIGIFFAGFLAALIWLLGDVATWVFAVLKATGH
jgi:hypothetical protein